MAKATAIPPEFHTVTPHLTVSDSQKALEFYKAAFGAESRGGCAVIHGKCIHAEMKIGDSIVFMHDEMPERGSLGPAARGGASASFLIYVNDVDAAFDKAVKAGCSVMMPVANQFWGDRYCVLTDPFGHMWELATHVEDVSPDDMKKRMDEAAKQMAGTGCN